MPLAIARIDTRQEGSAAEIERLRKKLAPTGDVVSEAGRKKTVEVFGVPLAPAEVVERICSDVRTRGLEAVVDYTNKFDQVKLTADSLRVPAQELAAAHAKAGPTFLEAIRRIRENILRFQTAILHQDVQIETPHGGYLRQRYLTLARISVDGADDGGAGAGGGRWRDRRRGAADAVWFL
jgi:histidinol dehydrogenase